jgi:outer membrane beta-barrel protein
MKARWTVRSVLGVVALCVAVPAAMAQERTPLDKELDRTWGQERDTRVIEKRVFQKDGRSEFGLYVGIAPNDDFWNYYPIGLRYDYYFNEQIAIEFSGAYVFSQSTKLKNFILDNYGVVHHGDINLAGVPQSVEWYAGLNAYWTPFHGKISAFNKKLGSFDLGLIVGAGAIGTALYDPQGNVLSRSKVAVMGDVGLGFHFFVTDLVAIRADYRHYIFPANDTGVNPGASGSARQMAEITLGVSIFTKAPQ